MVVSHKPWFIYYSSSTLKTVVVLFPLLGITWVFGVLVFATKNVVFQYIFTVSNSLQVCINKYILAIAKLRYFVFVIINNRHDTMCWGNNE